MSRAPSGATPSPTIAAPLRRLRRRGRGLQAAASTSRCPRSPQLLPDLGFFVTSFTKTVMTGPARRLSRRAAAVQHPRRQHPARDELERHLPAGRDRHALGRGRHRRARCSRVQREEARARQAIVARTPRQRISPRRIRSRSAPGSRCRRTGRRKAWCARLPSAACRRDPVRSVRRRRRRPAAASASASAAGCPMARLTEGADQRCCASTFEQLPPVFDVGSSADPPDDMYHYNLIIDMNFVPLTPFDKREGRCRCARIRHRSTDRRDDRGAWSDDASSASPAIEAARRRIAGRVLRTPLVRPKPRRPTRAAGPSEARNAADHRRFKLRGATNAVLSLDALPRQRGFVTASTGNHGRAVAHAARALGVARPWSACRASCPPTRSRPSARSGPRSASSASRRTMRRTRSTAWRASMASARSRPSTIPP